MKNLFYFLLLIYACSSKIAICQTQNFVNINIDGIGYQFLCEGYEGTSRITVTKNPLDHTSKSTVFEKNLEQTDDCSLGTWTVDPPNAQFTGTRLLTINPSQLGLNTQMLVFSVDSGNIFFAGYIPVAADRLGNLKFQLETADAGRAGVWRDVYEIIDNKVKMTGEQLLASSGSVCISDDGEARSLNVAGAEECKGRRISVTSERPLCIKYSNHKGKITNLKDCAGISKEDAN
ncbi:hypothetical protein [Paraburkholderia sp. J63]|uniref:hypothetical protein n=1 Tax=Paraburkholderia sp. J63 TaxID=2805434 RepID=UPI002ABDCB18|nr:hypothetical protein [Paraburkholderia sp. J63]